MPNFESAKPLTRSHAAPNPVSVRRRLLRWYDLNARVLPWRAGKGKPPDPYRVWLSEIMLQQTTVAAVKDYYLDFVTRWPKVEDLARAGLDEVLHAWQGLGYYTRARNLHKCARLVAADFGGRFPDTEQDLQKLPGIGKYTAAAIAAIAFGRKTMPIDANIERVTARLFAVADPLPKAHKKISNFAQGLASKSCPGDMAQAMMDLGATVCTAKSADCGACPLAPDCLGRKSGRVELYPVKPPKKKRPLRHGFVFWAVRDDGRVLLRKRPEKGLLGGMTEFPSTEWREKIWGLKEVQALAPVEAAWKTLDGSVRHTFTHFHLELTVLSGQVQDGNGLDGIDGMWAAPNRFRDHALPTVMKKVAKHVANNGD